MKNTSRKASVSYAAVYIMAIAAFSLAYTGEDIRLPAAVAKSALQFQYVLPTTQMQQGEEGTAEASTSAVTSVASSSTSSIEPTMHSDFQQFLTTIERETVKKDIQSVINNTQIFVREPIAPIAAPKPFCGDGIVQPEQGEQCDDGQSCEFTHGQMTCTKDEDCIRDDLPSARCVTTNHDLCSSCISHVCGDKMVQREKLPYQCDDGKHCANGVECTTDAECIAADGADKTCVTRSNDGCSAICETERCGDGVVQAYRGEECDEDGVDTFSCSNFCKKKLPLCSSLTDCIFGGGSEECRMADGSISVSLCCVNQASLSPTFVRTVATTTPAACPALTSGTIAGTCEGSATALVCSSIGAQSALNASAACLGYMQLCHSWLQGTFSIVGECTHHVTIAGLSQLRNNVITGKWPKLPQCQVTTKCKYTCTW